jgi:hypothetical protein
VHPHQFRHTFSLNWLAAGGGEQDLMMPTGCRSREVLAATAPRRRRKGARDAHQAAVARRTAALT